MLLETSVTGSCSEENTSSLWVCEIIIGRTVRRTNVGGKNYQFTFQACNCTKTLSWTRLKDISPSTDSIDTTDCKFLLSPVTKGQAAIHTWAAILLALVVSIFLCWKASEEFEKNWEATGFFPSLEETRWLCAMFTLLVRLENEKSESTGQDYTI